MSMKYVDEFRNAELIRETCDEIARLAPPDAPYRIMEICGGHTHTFYRFGLLDLLPETLDLIHGPGCPVCVLPMGRIDEGLSLTERPEVIFTAFGDVMRVPGRGGSPLRHKARGRDVRIVYSPLDALQLARKEPDRQVVFFAIGFETTAPSTALTVLQAAREGVENFTVFSNHITLMPAVRGLLEMPDMCIDAFIGPGHVSTVIGCRPYLEVAETYGRPLVVSGFEPLDLLQSIVMILRQRRDGVVKVENQYQRAVTWNGNEAALRAMDEVFEPRPSFEWRGLGWIEQSALQLRDAYAEFDAERRFADHAEPLPAAPAEHRQARCGSVLTGAIKPQECPLLGTVCTPEEPVGALMVSSEGACAAHFQYGAAQKVA